LISMDCGVNGASTWAATRSPCRTEWLEST
jgi:hypothetical protein